MGDWKLKGIISCRGSCISLKGEVLCASPCPIYLSDHNKCCLNCAYVVSDECAVSIERGPLCMYAVEAMKENAYAPRDR